MRNWSIRGVVHRISYTTGAGIGFHWPVSPDRRGGSSAALRAAPGSVSRAAQTWPRRARDGRPALASAAVLAAGQSALAARQSVPRSYALGGWRAGRDGVCFMIECSSRSWPVRLGLPGPVVLDGTAQRRARRCWRANRVWRGRPGGSRAGDTDKPKSFEKKAPWVSSRPGPRRDHLRGERDQARTGQAVLRSASALRREEAVRRSGARREQAVRRSGARPEGAALQRRPP
jgi:hypothetical protein